MTKNKITVTPNIKKARQAFRNIEKSKAFEFAAIVDRAYKPNPDPKDIRDIEKWLDKHPEIWTFVFDMSQIIEDNLIERIAPTAVAAIALARNVEDLRRGLGYADATAMEAALIDSIIVCWLRCQHAEYRLLMFMGQEESTTSIVIFWEKRLSVAQGRYLRACETLAKIRKLSQKNPLLQVNIATQRGQQVNVAGDLIKE